MKTKRRRPYGPMYGDIDLRRMLHEVQADDLLPFQLCKYSLFDRKSQELFLLTSPNL